MVQAQIQQKGFFHVIRNTGWAGLFHGWLPTLYRDVVFNLFFFCLRDIFVSYYTERFNDNEEPAAVTRMVLGLPSGVLASVVACPLDVVKTRVQGMEIGE